METKLIYKLEPGSKCPKCELGKRGLILSAGPLAYFEGSRYTHDFLHCRVCGAYFAGTKGEYFYIEGIYP